MRGPESRVNALQKVLTESIWVSGHKETFTASNLGIDVPDPKVDLLDPVVSVVVEIAELPVEKTFTGVPNAEGSPLIVRVSGPPSILNKLQPEDLKIGNSKLQVAPELEGKVKLKSVKNESGSNRD